MALIIGTPDDDIVRTAALGGSINGLPDATDDGDELRGEAGDDTLVAGASDDVVIGGDGNDTLIGNDGSDTLIGDDFDIAPLYGPTITGDDVLVGGGGDDVLSGGPGDDILDPGPASPFGVDLVAGGPGTDTLTLPGVPSDYLFDNAIGTTVTGPGGVNASVYDVELVAFGVTGEQFASGAVPLTVADFAALFHGSSADGVGRKPIALSDTVGAAQGTLQVLIDLRDLLRNDYDPDGGAQDLTGITVTFDAAAGNATALLDAVAISDAGFDPTLYSFGLLVVDLATPLTGDVMFRYRTEMTLSGTSFTDQSSKATVTISPVAAVDDRIIGSFGGQTFIPYASLLANDGAGAVFAGISNAYLFGGTIVDDPGRGGVVIDFPAFYRDFAYFEYAIAGSPDRASVEVELSNSPPVTSAIARVVAPGSSFTISFDEIRGHFGNFDYDNGGLPVIVAVSGPANPGGVTFQTFADRVELDFPAGYAGDFVLTYTLADQPFEARSLPSTISFLTAAPPAPVAVNETLNWGINSDGRTIFEGGVPGFGEIYSRELLANDLVMPGTVVVASSPRDTTPQVENLAIRSIQFEGGTSRSDTRFGFEFKDNFTGSDTYAYIVVDPLGRTATGLITLNVIIPQPVLADTVITIPVGATSVTVTAAEILGDDTFAGTGAIAQINANALIQVDDSGVDIGNGRTRLDGFTFDLDPNRTLDSYQFNVLAFDTTAAGGSASGWQVVTFQQGGPPPPPPPQPLFRLSVIENVEPEGGPIAFAITRVSGASSAATIQYAVGPGTTNPATADDLLGGFGTFTIAIPEGQDFARFSLFGAPDTVFEPDETISVSLVAVNVGTVDPTPVTAIIFNDDLPPPVFTLRLAENVMPEGTGAGNGGFIAFRVQRDPASDLAAATVLVGVTETGANPIDGYDLVTAFNGIPVTFAAGQVFAAFSLAIVPDAEFEPDETLSVFLAVTSLGTVDATPITAIIFNDDLPPPAFTLRVTENVELEGGGIAFGIERVSGAAGAAMITYAVGPGTVGTPASAGDMAGGFGTFTITIPEGVDFVPFSLSSVEDALFENDETISVALVSASFGTVDATPVTAIIFNDDVSTAPVASDFTINQVEDFLGLLFSLASLTTDPDDNVTGWSITTVVGGTIGGFDPISGFGSFLPTPDFNGEARIDWTVTDADGQSDSATYIIDIAPVNDAPVALPDSFSVQEGRVLSVAGPGVLGNDSDPDGEAIIAAQFDAVSVEGGAVTMVTDGSFTYTPPAGFSGTDTFTYRIFDGVAFSALATVTVEVAEGSPIAVADAFSVRPNQTLVVSGPGLLANDSDPNGDAIIAAQFDPVSAAGGTVAMVTDGSFTYTPPADFVGTDTFTYRIFDGVLFSDLATVTVAVVNAAPVAVADSFGVQEGRVLTVAGPGLLANDTDADGDAIIAAQFDPVSAAGGVVTMVTDGSFTYTPPAGFSGTDTFTCRIFDGVAFSELATVTVEVIEGSPIAIADVFTTAVNETLTVAGPGLLANDSDPNGDAIIAAQFDPVSAAGGTVAMVTDGSFTYTPPADFVGTDTFSYRIFDGVLFSDLATVTVTVGPPANTAPVAGDLARTETEDFPSLLFSLASLTADAEDNVVSYAVTSVVGGTLGGFDPVSGFGSFLPMADFNGEARIAWTATDAGGLSDSGAIVVTITPVNDAPTGLSLSAASIAENSAVGTVIGALSAADVDGDVLAFSLVGTPGPFAILGNELRVNGPIDFEATPTLPVTVRVSDGQGGVLDRAFTITVTDMVETGPVPIPPGFSFSNGSQGLGQGPAGPATTQGIATSLANGAFLIEATGVWNSVKNAFTMLDAWSAALGQTITAANFVDVRLDLDNAGTTDLIVTAIGAKRGEILTAGGDDTISVIFHSNEGLWNNTLRVGSGTGDDVVTATTVARSTLDEALLADNASPANGPLWNRNYDGRFSVLDVDLGEGEDTVIATDVRLVADGGAGNDALVGGIRNDSLTGGDGDDVLTGGLGADRFLFDSDDGTDIITDFSTIQGDKVVLEGGGGPVIAGASFTFGTTTVTAANGHFWTAADFLLA
ncbi:Ig-like domain-containing protein [Elioraea sp.]|uniref:Ig-like domain-containing protein n=1 Tax=Elioraea sp. TaxID=2185103 RepID=UPI0025BEEE82|nr:Ig-like domain-containing protein [Elioraea sp.]